MASTFSLQGKLGLDSKDFVTGAKKAEQAVGDVAEEMEDLPDTAKKSGGDAGKSLGANIGKAFAAVGVTAVIGQALNDAMDIEKGVDRVQAQFGLTADAAERYGKLGGDLYADAWGESSSEATASIAKVGEQLAEVGDISEAELSAITEQVYAVADVFGQDFDAVVRSVGNLLKNGLAVDAEEALDMVTVAFQGGNDRAGDLLDTIDEYSPYWAALGIEGEEALGLIQTGFQNGFRDADKLSDLIKEFGIRALTVEAEDAFEALGLSGGQMRIQFGEGGTAAREAFDKVVDGLRDVKDPLERNRLGVELFGTQWEDVGPEVLDVLDTIEVGLGPEGVEGAASEMAETVGDNTATAMEEMTRRVKLALAESAESMLPLVAAAEALADGDFGKAAGQLENVGKSAAEAAPGFWLAEKAVGAVTSALFGSDSVQRTAIDNWGEYTTATDESAGASKATSAAIDEARRNAVRFVPAVDDATDSVEDLGDEAGDTTSELDRMTDKFNAMKDSLSDRSAFLNVEDGFDGIKAKALEALSVAGENTDEARAKMREYEQAQIDLKNEVIDYAEEVGNIPPETVSEINALIDQGEFDRAEAMIAELEKDRTMTLTIATQLARGARLPGTLGMPTNAQGTDYWRGGPTWVGEDGPEIVNIPRGAQIIPAHQSAAMMAPAAMFSTSRSATSIVGGSTMTVVNHVSVQSLDAERAGQVITDSLNAFYQAGGQPANG